MEKLAQKIDQIIAGGAVHWERVGNYVRVELWPDDRHHRVHFKQDGDGYIFQSVVADSDYVSASTKRWNDLAIKAWRRNGAKQMVSFSFDDKDRLIGVIRLGSNDINADDLKATIKSIARECDRFEFVLTGEDTH